MAQIKSRFDSAPLQTQIDTTEPRWRKWLQDVWSNINAIALPPPSSITVTASPFTYQFLQGGQASIIISGGTVTLVEFSRNGSTYFTVGTGPGSYQLSAGDFLRVTYTVLPTMTLVLR